MATLFHATPRWLRGAPPLLAPLSLAGCGAIPQHCVRQDHSDARSEVIQGSELYHLLPAGAIPAADPTLDPRSGDRITSAG